MRHATLPALTILLLSGAGAACATSGTGAARTASPADSAAAHATSAPRRNSRRLTREEIRATSKSDLYDVIETLRPAWLRSAVRESGVTVTPIRVYLNNSPQGGPSALHGIDANGVEYVERLDVQAATLRFGGGNTQGAIVVVSSSQ